MAQCVQAFEIASIIARKRWVVVFACDVTRTKTHAADVGVPPNVYGLYRISGAETAEYCVCHFRHGTSRNGLPLRQQDPNRSRARRPDGGKQHIIVPIHYEVALLAGRATSGDRNRWGLGVPAIPAIPVTYSNSGDIHLISPPQVAAVIRDASLFRPLFPAETHGAGRPPVAGPRQLQVMLGGRLSQAGKTVPSFGPAWRQAGSRACPPVAGSKCRWILSVPRPARLGGFPAPESRYPAVCRRLPFWQFPCPSACPPPASLWRVPAVRRCRCNSALRTPRSALLFRNKLSTTAYGHTSMSQTVKFESKSVKTGSKSGQKRSKNARISSCPS